MGKDKRGDGTLDESENASVSRKQKREESPLVRMGSAPWASMLQEKHACVRV